MRIALIVTAAIGSTLAWKICPAFALAPPASAVRAVALSTSPLPGIPGGVMVEQFAFPRVDRFGRAAFKARFRQGFGGVDNSNDEAIWSEVGIDDLRLVARSSEPVPGINFRFHDVEPGENLRMSGNGTVYFVSGMSPITSPTTFNSGVFRFSKQNGLQLAVSSSPTGIPGVPSTGGQSISNFLDFNEQGDLTVTSSSGPDYFLPLGGNLTALPGEGPFVNDTREVAVKTADVIDSQLRVRNPTGAMRTIAEEGGVAPGTGGARFTTRGIGAYDNAAGATVFAGGLMGAGVADANDYGLWAEKSPGAPVTLLMREGDQPPGIEPGVVWSDFTKFTNPSFGRNGGIALSIGLAGPGVTDGNQWGVWSGTVSDGLHLVARSGDPAPGTEAGTVFDFFSQAGVTQDGRGVFFAFLTGPGLSPNRDRGIWAEGDDGMLHLIARRGDTVLLTNGATVTLTSVQFHPHFGVSELGSIAFVSNVGAGQGVFVSNLVAIPEPSTLATSVLATYAAWIGRRRKAFGSKMLRKGTGVR